MRITIDKQEIMKLLTLDRKLTVSKEEVDQRFDFILKEFEREYIDYVCVKHHTIEITINDLKTFVDVVESGMEKHKSNDNITKLSLSMLRIGNRAAEICLI